MKKLVFSLFLSALSVVSFAQSGPDEDQLGTWYMYFYNKSFKNSQFGIQGDVQLRLWSPVSDLEQLLLRSGLTYTPENANILFTLGYAHITTGAFGESDDTVLENRIYQEVLFPTSSALEKGVVYLALYNEIFINGQRDIGDGRTVELFDRNRLYLGGGYGLLSNLRVQGGWMLQTTDNWSKGQLQVSLHHKF